MTKLLNIIQNDNGIECTTTIDHEHMALMCPKCFNIIYCDANVNMHCRITDGVYFNNIKIMPRFIFDCPSCHESYYGIVLDAGIAICISELNKRGYITVASSSGNETDDTTGYIKFKRKVPTIKDLPEGWYISSNKLITDYDKILFRISNKDIERYEDFINLYTWILSLPNRYFH